MLFELEIDLLVIIVTFEIRASVFHLLVLANITQSSVLPEGIPADN